MNNGEGSSSTSFVKRSKPRSSASRISSTYDDAELTTANGSSSAMSSIGSRLSTPRRTVPELEPDEEEQADAANVVFRPRARGSRGTTSSATASSSKAATSLRKERPTISAMEDEEEDGDSGDTFEIRRSNLSIAGKQARLSAAGLSSTTPKRSTPLRPTSFQSQLSAGIPATESSSADVSSTYTSKYLEELRSSTPTTSSRAQTPPAPVGPGIRIDDPMLSQTAHLSLTDNGDDSLLARSKYPSEFAAHDAIPSESVIRAAKEKRAKLRANAATATAHTSSSADDFISLTPYGGKAKTMALDDGPHPHSRLQREDDEFGDGEEEFADYTGATERIPIGEKAEKEWKDKQRREMEAALRGDFDPDTAEAEAEGLDEMDEDEQEWERSQLRRTQVPSAYTSHSREASPFRAAPVPKAISLPSVGTCSTRLSLTLRALEQSIAASDAVVNSAEKELETLEKARGENEADVEAVEEKASWFAELDEFVTNLARFMEEKVGAVEEAESEALELQVRRCRMLGRRRARWLPDRFERCFEVKLQKFIVPNFASAGEEQGDGDVEMNEDGNTLKGEGEAEIDATQLDKLSAADELSYTLASDAILSKLQEAFADVQATEYLDPVATVSSTLQELHPRSIVSRFEEYRQRYPEEYSQIWGGLSVAQIWEFYARLEMVSWDAFSSSSPSARGSEGGWQKGADAISHFRWFTGASDYIDRAAATSEDVIGGDDEVLSSLTANVLVDKLVTLAKKGAFDPWSATQTKEAVEAVETVQTVLGNGHVRCETLLDAFLAVFASQIERLQEVLSPILAQPGGSGGIETAAAAQDSLDEMVDGLLRNLMGWAKVISMQPSMVPPPSTKTFVNFVESLVLEIIEPILAKFTESHGGELQELVQRSRQKVSQMLPKTVLATSARLSSHFLRA